jgi:hypothetical protein
LSRRGERPEKSKRKSSFCFAPIGFGFILVNIPLSGVRLKDGFMRIISDAGSGAGTDVDPGSGSTRVGCP